MSDAIDAAVEHALAQVLTQGWHGDVRPLIEAAAPVLERQLREQIARDIEVAHGLRCPECYGKPASIRGFKHQCGGGHKWEQPLGSWYVSGAIAIARGSVAGKPGGGSE